MEGRTYKGHNGQVEVTGSGVIIRRAGVLAVMTQGLKGEKSIPFTSITSIQFKKAGLFNGYIQFGVAGGKESRGGVFDATSDENTIMFRSGQGRDFENLREEVQRQLDESRAPAAGSVLGRAAVSVPDELAKLADLRDRGVLTDDEFAEQKKRLLTS